MWFSFLIVISEPTLNLIETDIIWALERFTILLCIYVITTQEIMAPVTIVACIIVTVVTLLEFTTPGNYRI